MSEGVECWKMWKGFLVCALFWALARLTFVARFMLCRMPTEPAKKASHTHTRTYTHAYIVYIDIARPYTPFRLWPSLIDCLTRGPANNLQFLLQSQSASCPRFLSLSFPSLSLYIIPFSFILELLHLPLRPNANTLALYKDTSRVQNNCTYLKFLLLSFFLFFIQIILHICLSFSNFCFLLF